MREPKPFLILDKVIGSIKRTLPVEIQGWLGRPDQQPRIDYAQETSQLIPGLAGRLTEGLESEDQQEIIIAQLHRQVEQLVQRELEDDTSRLSSEVARFEAASSTINHSAEAYRRSENLISIASLAARF